KAEYHSAVREGPDPVERRWSVLVEDGPAVFAHGACTTEPATLSSRYPTRIGPVSPAYSSVNIFRTGSNTHGRHGNHRGAQAHALLRHTPRTRGQDRPLRGLRDARPVPDRHHRRAQGGARAMRAVRRLAHGRVHCLRPPGNRVPEL